MCACVYMRKDALPPSKHIKITGPPARRRRQPATEIEVNSPMGKGFPHVEIIFHQAYDTK